MNAHTNVHADAHTRHTGNVTIGACVYGDSIARKLRIAQLQVCTISGHVVAVSAQQRAGCNTIMYTKAKWVRGRSVL